MFVYLLSVRLKRWPGGQWLSQTASGHRVSKSGGPNGHQQIRGKVILNVYKYLQTALEFLLIANNFQAEFNETSTQSL